MQVIKTLVVILFVISALALCCFFVSRELFLWWGVSSFKDSLASLQQSTQGGSYVQECARRTENSATGNPQVQLRFTSNTEYVIEAVCSQFSANPILIEKKQLTPFITKVPGSSGVIWGDARSSVKLAVFEDLVKMVKDMLKINVAFLEKTKTIGVDGSSLLMTTETVDLGEGPITSCEGYGYQCCQSETEIGVGEHISGVPACEKSCYSSCSKRPVILAFNSNPLLDPKNRQVVINSGNSITFNYVGDSTSDTNLQAFIDYGDRTPEEKLVGSVGQATHAYTCLTSTCVYTAKLRLHDTWGVDSFDSVLSSIQVKVNSSVVPMP